MVKSTIYYLLKVQMFLFSISSCSDGQLTRFQQIPCWTEISSLSDEELFALYDRCEPRFPHPSKTKFTSVRQIASDVVMKGDIVTDSEPLTMSLVRESTTILVPAVRRFLKVDRRMGFVMEYIPGKTVSDCWSRLGLFQCARLFWTLRRYIRQLRSEQFPGPIGREPQLCYGPMFSCDWVSSSRLRCIQVLCTS